MTTLTTITLQPGDQVTIKAAPLPVVVPPPPPPVIVPPPVVVPPPPVSARPFPAPVTTRTVTVAAGANVVAAVAAAPNGSIISLAAGATYNLSSPVNLNSRSNIILLGNGATLNAAAGYMEASSAIQAFGASDIAIRNVKIVGQSPTPGVQISGHEGAHGIRLVGGTRIEIDSCDISNVYGDGANTDYWTDGVWMHGCYVHGTSRCGFAVLAGKNILIEGNTFAYNAGMVLDIEPYQAAGGADTVTFRNNTSTWQGASNDPSQPYRSEDWFFAANQAFGGTRGIKNIIVTGNTLLHGSIKSEMVLPGTGLRFSNVTFANNTSVTAMAGPALVFAHVDGLTITGNKQPLSSGSLISVSDCTSSVTSPNP